MNVPYINEIVAKRPKKTPKNIPKPTVILKTKWGNSIFKIMSKKIPKSIRNPEIINPTNINLFILFIFALPIILEPEV